MKRKFVEHKKLDID